MQGTFARSSVQRCPKVPLASQLRTDNVDLVSLSFPRHLELLWFTSLMVIHRSAVKRGKITQGRSLLGGQIFCKADYRKHAFQVARIVTALYLDMALRVDSAVDILWVSSSNRRLAEALMNAMGGELT